MKKVVFVGGNLYPYRVGGYEVFNYYLFKQITDSTITAQILNNYPRPDYCSKGDYKRANIRQLKSFNSVFYFLYFLFARNKKQMLLVLSYARSRWIHLWPYVLLKKMCGLSYIVIIHGGGLTKWDIPFVHKKFLLNADEIIGISHPICKEYGKRTGRELQYIPPIIPFENYTGDRSTIRQKYKIEQDAFVFLIVGSIKGLKNPQAPIQAAHILGATYLKDKNIHFLFAGDGVMRTEIETLIQEFELADSVTLLGNVSRDDLSSIYSIADAYIMSSDFEGTPISMLEAMYNSLLILGSNVSGINSVLEHDSNGFLFEKNNYNQLADYIKKLVELDEKRKQSLKNRARNYLLENFNYPNLLEHYKLIINKKR